MSDVIYIDTDHALELRELRNVVESMVLMRDGEVETSTLELFKLASRTPDMVAGDLLAQAAANATGAARLADLVARTGSDRFEGAVDRLIDATSRRIEQKLRTLEGAEGAFEDVLEWYQEGDAVDLPVKVHARVDDGRLIVDFAGTAGQVAGPVNAPRHLTVSCVLYVLKAMLDPDVASNAGLFERIEVRTPARSIVDLEGGRWRPWRELVPASVARIEAARASAGTGFICSHYYKIP